MTLAAARHSLLPRLLLATSLAVTVVFALTGWMVQRYAASVSQRSLEEEVRTSLYAYESLWGARVHTLTAVSRVISSMSDVRAAFTTGDRATIRDTAEQLWDQISEQDASFVVLTPTGAMLTSLGGDPDFAVDTTLVRDALPRFPKQVTGYLQRGRQLYYVVLTPVYVEAAGGPALLNILLVALHIDDALAETLKHSTHGSDFAFLRGEQVFASTLPLIGSSHLSVETGRVGRLQVRDADYLALGTDLADPTGMPLGQLLIIRPFGDQEAVLMELQRNVALFWCAAILVCVALTVLLARRILRPVQRLDRAAEEVSRRNYRYRVPVETDDELGRLAATFNTMCDSIEHAREELVRQEQIATIGRLSTSIVHDLRNPLAAIYGGAEMLVESGLTPEQSRRLAATIYAASRQIQELLQELMEVSRAKRSAVETCRLLDVISGAVDVAKQSADARHTEFVIEVAPEIQVMADRDRMERVFLNLINNSIEAMPRGGVVRVAARVEERSVLIEWADNGRGIPEEVWSRLFQPFATFGKRNGLGLGLALSRQTLLDHSGDLWAEKHEGTGARFLIRLPMAETLAA